MHRDKGERFWSFSLFSCSFTAWLWFVSLLSALARTQPRHSSGEFTPGSFHQNIRNYPVSLPLFSHSIIHFAFHSLLQYMQYTHYMSLSERPDGLQNAVFWTLSAESSRSRSSCILEAPRYDWGIRIPVLKGANLCCVARSQSTLLRGFHSAVVNKRQTANKLNRAKALAWEVTSISSTVWCLLAPLPGLLLPHELLTSTASEGGQEWFEG